MTTIVFDLDGTLVDSAPDLHAAAAKLLVEEGRDPLPLATIRGFIGNGVPKLVERVAEAAVLGRDPARLEALTARFMTHYMAAPARLTRAFPHVLPVLEFLGQSGHRLGICTNKPEAPTRAILAALGLSRHIQVVVGGDTLPQRKPDPAPLRLAFQQLGALGLYVGDSEVDAATAETVGVPFLHYTEGYRQAPGRRIAAEASFADFAELPALVEALAEPAA